ncbi:MAG: acyl dehydratase [Pseudonocardiales bacterium]|nr:acyl dehydratase [Jatrophihabitantaceae bacterium]MCW2601931.1 acyl dehydratase [Pseudonocardiales bacterium]
MAVKAWTAETVVKGASQKKVVIENLTRTQIVMYAGASGDFNPLHTDEIFASKIAGYDTVFAHGMLSMGATGTLVTDVFGNGTLTGYGVRFRSQVFPGDTLTATATVTDVARHHDSTVVTADIETVNQKGEVVVSGTATAALPH